MSTTPRTDAACFSATTERPESGDYELQVVYADFARNLELEIAPLKERSDVLAAIEVWLAKEFQQGDRRSGDLLDDFVAFFEHHKAKEAELTALRSESPDELSDESVSIPVQL